MCFHLALRPSAQHFFLRTYHYAHIKEDDGNNARPVSGPVDAVSSVVHGQSGPRDDCPKRNQLDSRSGSGVVRTPSERMSELIEQNAWGRGGTCTAYVVAQDFAKVPSMCQWTVVSVQQQLRGLQASAPSSLVMDWFRVSDCEVISRG